jgi:hypothetical protein
MIVLMELGGILLDKECRVEMRRNRQNARLPFRKFGARLSFHQLQDGLRRVSQLAGQLSGQCSDGSHGVNGK